MRTSWWVRFHAGKKAPSSRLSRVIRQHSNTPSKNDHVDVGLTALGADVILRVVGQKFEALYLTRLGKANSRDCGAVPCFHLYDDL